MGKSTKLRLLFFLPLAILLPLLTSCARLSYNYENVRYDTPEPAFEAQKKDLDAILGSIKASESPVGGKAVLILPSKVYVIKNVVVWKGPDPGAELKERGIDFPAQTVINELNALGRCMEKRRIFDSVVIINSANPEDADFSESVALKFFKKEAKMRWFVVRKNAGGTPNVREIEDVPTSLPPNMRVNLWLERIEKAAKGL